MTSKCIFSKTTHSCKIGWGSIKSVRVETLTLISSKSLNLDGHWGTTVDVATIPFHLSLSSAALRESSTSIQVHSLVLSFLLTSSPSCYFHCPLQDCFRHVRCGHTIWVSVSSPCLGGHHALQLHSWIYCESLRSAHRLCRQCSKVSYSISYQGLGSFLSRSSSPRHKGR